MQDKIRSLRIKGFSDEEIAKLLKIDIKEIPPETEQKDISKDSLVLYSEMQKDLSKLILTEMGKETRDSTVILNAIRLQSELQEKKLRLTKGSSDIRIETSYINKRDEEICTMLKEGVKEEAVAKKLGISILSIRLAKDRVDLGLPTRLRELSPSIITETKGLPREKRLEILELAVNNGWSRDEVRSKVILLKNELRCL